jgi:5-epi-alpha-selinene synthase
MQQIVEAKVYCPFPWEVHPFMEEACEQVYLWMHRCEIVRSETELDRFRYERIPHLFSYVYPTSGFDELVWASKCFAWSVALDNFCDDLHKRPPESIMPMLSQLVSALTIDKPAHLNPREPLLSPFVVSIHDLWDEVFSSPPLYWRERFSRHLEGFIIAYAQEADNRICRKIPDLESYLTLRRASGSMPAYFDLIEYTNSSFCPPSIATCPQIQKMREVIVDYVNWVNDLYSYNKECLVGDFHNLIPILQQQDQLSVQGAVEKVCQMISSCVRTFLEIGERLPALFPDSSDVVRDYVRHMSHWFGGYCHWHSTSPRYHILPHAEMDTASFSFIKTLLVTEEERYEE